MAVTVAGNTGGLVIALRRMPPVAGAGKHRVQFCRQHRLDEAAHPFAQARFDGVKPVVEKIVRRLSLTMIGIGIHGNHGHGVVSCPTLQRRMIRG